MYKIIGADGKEYGPISVDQLRQWLNEGRINAQSKVLAEGATEWKTLAEIPELAGTTPVTPPSLPSFHPGTAAAASQVIGPAIGLIVTAVLGFVAAISGTLWNLLATGASFRQPGMPPEMEHYVRVFSGSAGVIGGIVGIIVAGLILFGALKMKKCENYGWAMTASIVAMIPCISPCCLVGLPIGIWALVVLSKPEVKSAFH